MSLPALLLDTSCAVPLLLADADQHGEVRARVRGHSLGLAGHARFETYSVLTRLPRELRVSPEAAARALAHNFPIQAYLDARQQGDALEELARLAIHGGSVYDGLVALAARSTGILLLTHDRRATAVYNALGCKFELI